MFKKLKAVWNLDWEDKVYLGTFGCTLSYLIFALIFPCIVLGGIGWVVWKLMAHYGVL